MQGRQVILREKRLEDADNDYAWASDHELMRLDAAEPCNIAYSIYLLTYPDALRDPTKLQFAVETLEGKHIGNCVCYNIDKSVKEAELGIMIGDRAYWGEGYGMDTVKTLMNYIFKDLGMSKVSLHTLEWNIRAQECFQRCGFNPVGRMIRRGQEFIEMEAMAPTSEPVDNGQNK